MKRDPPDRPSPPMIDDRATISSGHPQRQKRDIFLGFASGGEGKVFPGHICSPLTAIPWLEDPFGSHDELALRESETRWTLTTSRKEPCWSHGSDLARIHHRVTR